ncbi:catalase [Pseudomonas sp. Au-Pse12]|nr:catalase [Pseudomonas sp. Au-Pse12]
MPGGLAPAKLIPEERGPITPLGKRVLERNPDNYFAGTERVAFCRGHIGSGIERKRPRPSRPEQRFAASLLLRWSRLAGEGFTAPCAASAPSAPVHGARSAG